MKKHAGFIIFFTLVLVLYLWKLVIMRSAFLHGDYAAQFYPWSKILSDSIKNLSFPYWTRYFHSGFPLMAEGQVGGFYPLNLIFFFLLPFKGAYNYLVILHFALAGIFTYLYTRKLGACQWGGSLAALLFCFGSAYAGCFYNTVTVKTLIWVPLVLFLFELYFEKKMARYILIAGVVLGMQFLAGFAQLALYSALFYVVYFVYGLHSRKELGVKPLFTAAAGLAISLIIFLPQLLLSLQLAGLSGRSGATLGFALWGSFAPFNFMSLVFPHWVFTGTRFYIGIFSLFFLTISFFAMKQDRKLRPLVLVLLFSLFLAIGKYNPLYVLVLKTFHFYSFRNPSKFLFFGMLAASVLAGCGFTRFFSQKDENRSRVARCYLIFTGVMVATFFVAKTVLVLFGGKILQLGKWYVSKYVYGQTFHKYELNSYLERVEGFYATFVSRASLTDPYIIFSLILCVMTMAGCVFVMKKDSVKKGFRIAVFSVIFVDLFVFSLYGTGLRGNIKDFEVLAPEHSKLFDVIKNDHSTFRIAPFGIASGKMPNWAMPNLNAVYGIDSIAGYSPLAPDSYKKALNGLEVVDDSLGLLEPDSREIGSYLKILRALNVKYIVSAEKLDHDFLEEKARDGDIYIYEMNAFLPRGYVSRDGVISTEEARLLHYESGKAIFEANMRSPGKLVFSEMNYPGWVVTVNDKPAEIKSFNGILMSVELELGTNKIVFELKPFFRQKTHEK